MSQIQLPSPGPRQEYKIEYKIIENTVWNVIKLIGTLADGTKVEMARETVPTNKTPQEIKEELEVQKEALISTADEKQAEIAEWISQLDLEE